ncbi:hypothetical protein BF28_2296 [Bacillus cereus E33L]|nr:hypothetical protein BF28_2296 [Bacillus cereus E33L]
MTKMVRYPDMKINLGMVTYLLVFLLFEKEYMVWE